MYQDTLADIGDAAVTKARLTNQGLGGYLVHSGMAGAYVGLGIVLIFAFGTPLSAEGSPFTGFVMAATFGVALSLVIAAGSDLFTGNTMIMAVGALKGRTTWGDLWKVWGWSWIGNLAGSALVAGLAFGAGTFAGDTALVLEIASAKMNAPAEELFFRAILCNWLVVLAVWSSFKMENEVAQLVMIWWCLLAFIGSGYEHSVANMTLLTLANLLPHGASVSWAGMFYNLIPVTLGNIASGMLLMGGAYWYVANEESNARPDESPAVPSPAVSRSASRTDD